MLSPPFESLADFTKYLKGIAPDIASYVVVDINSGKKIGLFKRNISTLHFPTYSSNKNKLKNKNRLFNCILGLVNFINIVPEHKRLELGNIWYFSLSPSSFRTFFLICAKILSRYTPKFHKTYANTEAIYLCLRHSFVALKQRRVEWKCGKERREKKNRKL